MQIVNLNHVLTVISLYLRLISLNLSTLYNCRIPSRAAFLEHPSPPSAYGRLLAQWRGSVALVTDLFTYTVVTKNVFLRLRESFVVSWARPGRARARARARFAQPPNME